MSDSGNFTSQGGTVITGAEDIDVVSLLALRGALRLEVRGMKRRGRSAQQIANERMGTKIRAKRATYEAFDKWLTGNYGESHRVTSRPL
jgi:hypothetical protein